MESSPQPTQRGLLGLSRTDWSRALETIVHGGMAVGMTVFVAIELLNAAYGGSLLLVKLPMSGVAVVVTLVLRRSPLVGLSAMTAVSLGVSVWGWAFQGLLGVRTGFVGFAEVAAISILASEVARRLAPARVVVGLGMAAVIIAIVTLRSGEPFPLLTAFWLVLTIAVVAGLALRWAERSRQMSEDVTRREERLSIARELHDTVAHHVTGIVVQAQAARAVGRRDPDAIEQALASIEESGLDTMRAMRRLVGALRGDASAHQPVSPTSGLAELAPMAEDAAARDGYEVAVDVDEHSVPPSVGPSIYRIVQESLTNIRRHGVEVSQVEITVRAQDDGVQVMVVDDGRRHERPGERGFGLTGMAERVAALGGQFWAGTRPNRGWAVTAWIPLSQ